MLWATLVYFGQASAHLQSAGQNNLDISPFRLTAAAAFVVCFFKLSFSHHYQ
jgi:hypothetical protein